MLGIYIHIPFCKRKCPYCDFYSVADLSAADCYTDRILSVMEQYSSSILSKKADTLYFGGGTPSLMPVKNISRIIDKAAGLFDLSADAEITMEINPATADGQYYSDIRRAGVNRISIGMQSANDNELRLLGRLHTNSDTLSSVDMAKKAGFDNISLDLMLGIPQQDERSLMRSLEQCRKLNPSHISAYMLKIEPGTPFARNLPGKIADDEQSADIYKMVCKTLERYGFCQYEISNWSKNGKYSRHNIKYWQLEDYLGLGPGAHSFINGKRYFFDRDLNSFMDCATWHYDGNGGDPDEYIMLSLRLSRGVIFSEYQKRCGMPIPQRLMDKMKILSKNGLGVITPERFYLNTDGMLLSNSAIAFILD